MYSDKRIGSNQIGLVLEQLFFADIEDPSVNIIGVILDDGVNSLDVATQLTDDAGLSGVDAQGGQCVKATVAAQRHSDANQQKRLPTNPFLRAPETMAVTTKTLIAA